jgi:transposase
VYKRQDECSVEFGAGKQRTWVFRTSQQKWNSTMIEPYNKSKACTIMVWGVFGGNRRSQLVLCFGDIESKHQGVTAAVYREILEDELPTLWEPGYIFMQDNALIYTARIIKEFFEEEGIERTEWPRYSPDLNPIEHVWAYLKEWVYMRYPELLELKGKGQEVKDIMLHALQEVWEVLNEKFLDSLVLSMKRRVEAVIRAEGWYIKY